MLGFRFQIKEESGSSCLFVEICDAWFRFWKPTVLLRQPSCIWVISQIIDLWFYQGVWVKRLNPFRRSTQCCVMSWPSYSGCRALWTTSKETWVSLRCLSLELLKHGNETEVIVWWSSTKFFMAGLLQSIACSDCRTCGSRSSAFCCPLLSRYNAPCQPKLREVSGYARCRLFPGWMLPVSLLWWFFWGNRLWDWGTFSKYNWKFYLI